MADPTAGADSPSWAEVIREAGDLLIELADVDLLPEEFIERGRILGGELVSIADEMADN